MNVVLALNKGKVHDIFPADAASGAGTAYSSRENEFTQGFNGVHIARSLVSCFLGGGGSKSFYISPLPGPIFLMPVEF
jgi:hypothetical protein